MFSASVLFGDSQTRLGGRISFFPFFYISMIFCTMFLVVKWWWDVCYSFRGVFFVFVPFTSLNTWASLQRKLFSLRRFPHPKPFQILIGSVCLCVVIQSDSGRDNAGDRRAAASEPKTTHYYRLSDFKKKADTDKCQNDQYWHRCQYWYQYWSTHISNRPGTQEQRKLLQMNPNRRHAEVKPERRSPSEVWSLQRLYQQTVPLLRRGVGCIVHVTSSRDIHGTLEWNWENHSKTVF